MTGWLIFLAFIAILAGKGDLAFFISLLATVVHLSGIK